MKDIKLGISLYPEQEAREDVVKYIRTAAKYGFTRIFTSMFSVPGTAEEVLAFFKDLCDIAHENGMIVIADANPQLFARLGASESNLEPFARIGMDGLRMDAPFADERDITLTNNPYGIQIVSSTAMQGKMDDLIAACGTEKITVCHNFYPQRYSGISFEQFNKLNAPFVEKNIKIEAFVTSQVKGAHGPWPVWDGLVTVEDMRNLPIDAQARIMIMLGTIDYITISNAFASEDELKALKETIDFYKEDHEKFVMLGGIYKCPIGEKRHILDIVTEDTVSDIERKLVFEYPAHMDLGDGFNYYIRSRMTRFGNDKFDIPYVDPGKPYFQKGDVMVVNNNCRHYMGEVQICLKPMKNDGQRNLVGHVEENELILVDMIGASEIIRFKEMK